MLESLEEAIEELDIPPDGDAIARAIALRDRLDARIASAVADFDAAGGWQLDAATSMTAWLRHHAAMTSRSAGRLASLGRRLRRLPVTAAAFATGALSAGQVEAVLANVDERSAGLFEAHEAEVVPGLAPLTVAQVGRAMGVWRARAEAVLPEPPEAADPERSVHLSATLDGRYVLDGSLDPEGGAVLAAALRLADAGPPPEGEPRRGPAARRGDALVDVCRHFLTHQRRHVGGRHRPHLNVVVDLEALEAERGGEVVGGPRLDGPTLSRLLCDSALHRVLTAGGSAVLDYGTATRTIPAPLWNSLVIRDRHCRFPGCDRPPQWCEGHHIVWFSRGGRTGPDNTCLLCTRHHHLLHLPGWEVKLLPDGTLVVTDPGGRVRTSAPPGVATRP